MPDEYQRFRLPGAVFPLRFEMAGRNWELRTFPVAAAGSWRCHLEAPGSVWFVTSSFDEPRLLAELRETGVSMLRRSFVAAAFRRLSALGVAEVV